MKKRIVCLTLVFVMLFTTAFVSYAVNDSDLQKQQKEAAEEKNNARKKINEINNQQKNINQKIEAIESNISSLSNEIYEINSEIAKIDSDLSIKEQELNDAISKEQSQDETFKKRVRVMYEDGTFSYISILLSSESIFDFFYRIDILKEIANYDKNLLTDYKQNRELIEVKKNEISQIKESKETQKAALESKQTSLNGEVDQMQNAMEELKIDKAAFEKEYNKAVAEENRIKAEIQSKLSKSSTGTYTGGKLNHPCPDYPNISSPYGMRTHPTLGQYKLHTGTDFPAPTGTSVLAAEAGTVVTATYSNAYGNYIIIDHGNGLSTLYAHNSKLLVSAGSKVTRGQVISKSGTTGFSTGPHVHFEVMINGRTTDPMPYLR